MSNVPPPAVAAAAGSAPTAPVVRDDRFPPGIPYIVGNEAAERFSYYGMRQILYIYLVGLFTQFAIEQSVGPEALSLAKVKATQWTHLFMAGVYLFPMVGAILADRLLGKYRVIFWVSLVYVAGHAALAVAGRLGELHAFGPTEVAMITGLALIAVGSGGIKPCVSANVGDQFSAKNGHLVSRIFQIFYFTVNFGSFFASLLTPWIYKNFGPELAFGVPGILMAVAAIVFWSGRDKFVRVPPKPGGDLGRLDFFASSLMAVPLLCFIYVAVEKSESLVHAVLDEKGPTLLNALGAVVAQFWWLGAAGLAAFVSGLALFNLRQKRRPDSGFMAVTLYAWRNRKNRQPGEGFWGPGLRHYGEEAGEGPAAVLRIVVVFSMVSVFWALFDQHSSTWVEQAKSMNLTLTVPTFVWYGWLVPVTILSALYGALWLVLWVSNHKLPNSATLGFLGLLAVWLAVATGWQLLQGGSSEIKLLAAQISALNPLFVMIIIPLLNVAVYRPFEKGGTPLKPLVRMTVGMFLAAVAFASVALIQKRIEAAGAGQIHVLWQIIPYFVMTVAEVMVSVTGLEFAYTQAPRAMKSTVMSFWLLGVTMGNVLVAFLAPLQALSLSTFFWTFAGLMAAAATVFAILASFYRGKTYLQPGA